MDEIDAQIQAVQAELAALKAQPVAEEVPWYSPKQLAFDVPVGVAKAGAGLADILSYPVIKGAQLAGVSPETLPTFGMTKLIEAGMQPVAEDIGVRPSTGTQELISFLSPSPLSKARVAAQAGTGLASYLGMKGAEAVAPESEYAGLVGALAAPAAISSASKAIGAAAPKLEEAGLGLQRKALGLTKADYKNAKNAVIETVDGNFSTQLKESVDDLIKNKTLGTSLDPGAMFAELQSAKSATEDAIQATLKAAEAKVGPVPPPDFNKTIDYISKNIAADQVDKYVNNVIEFQDALRREGQGSLTYLNQQKKIIGENWKNSPQSDPGFWRTIYGDVKRHIEKYAPEVKDLNKEKQKLIIAEPIVARNFKASGADYDIGTIQRLLNTTGGAGLAGGAILGAGIGALTGSDAKEGAGVGALSALALRGLATPRGQNITGRGLRSAGSLAESLGGARLDVGAALQRGGLAAGGAETPILSNTLEDNKAQYVSGQSLADALKAQVDKAPMLSEQSPNYVDDLKYDLPALNDLYKQNNLGTLVINKTQGTQTFVPGFNAPIPAGLLKPEDEVEIKTNVQEIKGQQQSKDIDAAIKAVREELESLRSAPATQPTKESESIKVGKQDVSIPVGEQYAPPKLVQAMIDVESSFDPKAVSNKGAKGLMQLMPGTAQDLGLAKKDIFDPNKNVEAGSRYMKQQMDQIPDLQASIAAYNWGIGNVLAALDKAEAKGKPRTWASIRKSAPTETQRYVDKVLMKYRMLEA